MAHEQLYVLSGPSGSGKSTLVSRLMVEYPDNFGFCVSHTTRNPRPGEENGKHYHFVSRETMMNGIADGLFIEHAEFSGNVYGTSREAVAAVLKSGKICLLDIDMQGVKSVKKAQIPATFVFIQPPNMEELEKRLRGRGTEKEEAVLKRLAAAKAEMEYGQEKGNYDHIIVNDKLDDAYACLRSLLTPAIKSLEEEKKKLGN